MAFIKDWEEEVRELSLEKLDDIDTAFRILGAWVMFEVEFKDCKIPLLRSMVSYEIKSRNWKADEGN